MGLHIKLIADQRVGIWPPAAFAAGRNSHAVTEARIGA